MTRILLCSLLALAACGEKEPQMPGGRSGEYQGDGMKLYEVPDFMLLESRGVALQRADLEGKVWVGSTIFTRCPTHCTLMCAEMRKLQEEFGKEQDFRIVAATVDPAYDTPDVLKKFARQQEALPDTWLFLTGDQKSVLHYADGLKVSPDPENPLVHSTYFVLVDKTGWVRGVFQQTDPDRMKKLREMIRTLLAEKAA